MILSKGFITLCLTLATRAYIGNFGEYQPYIIGQQTVPDISKPVFYVLKKDETLFVVTRGSQNTCDFETVLDMDDVITPYGTFHSGFFKAGKYVYDSVKTLLDNNTHVYFIGHSYGGAVSASCVAMLKSMNVHAPVTAITFGCPPVMHSENQEVKAAILSFVNDYDMIPTLSAPNLLRLMQERLKTDMPEKSAMRDEFLQVLDSYKTDGVPAGAQVVAALKAAAELFVEKAWAHSQGNIQKVRFPPGILYHISNRTVKALDECRVSPRKVFANFQANSLGVACHPPKPYFSALECVK